jgi:hypothetical protein
LVVRNVDVSATPISAFSKRLKPPMPAVAYGTSEPRPGETMTLPL